jgi:hypothetical protein
LAADGGVGRLEEVGARFEGAVGIRGCAA